MSNSEDECGFPARKLKQLDIGVKREGNRNESIAAVGEVSRDETNAEKCGFSNLEPEEICLIAIQWLILKMQEFPEDNTICYYAKAMRYLLEQIRQFKGISLYFKWAMETCVTELPIAVHTSYHKEMKENPEEGDQNSFRFVKLLQRLQSFLFFEEEGAFGLSQLDELFQLLPKLKIIKRIKIFYFAHHPDVKSTKCCSHLGIYVDQVIEVLKRQSIRAKKIFIDQSIRDICHLHRNWNHWKQLVEYCEEWNCEIEWNEIWVDGYRKGDNENIRRILLVTKEIEHLVLGLRCVIKDMMKIVFVTLAECNIQVDDWVIEETNFSSSSPPLAEMRRYFRDHPPKHQIYVGLSIGDFYRFILIFEGLEIEPMNKLTLPLIDDNHEFTTVEKLQLRQIIRIGLKIAMRVFYFDKQMTERFDDDFYDSVFSVLEEPEVQSFPGKIDFHHWENANWNDLIRRRAAFSKIVTFKRNAAEVFPATLVRLDDGTTSETMKLLFGILADSNQEVEEWKIGRISADLPLEEMRRYFGDYPPKVGLHFFCLSTSFRFILQVFDGLQFQQPMRKIYIRISKNESLNSGKRQQLRNLLRTALRIAKKVHYYDKNCLKSFLDDEFYDSVFSVLEEEKVQDFPGKLFLSGDSFCPQWSDLKRRLTVLGKIGKFGDTDGGPSHVLVKNEAEKIEADTCLEDVKVWITFEPS